MQNKSTIETFAACFQTWKTCQVVGVYEMYVGAKSTIKFSKLCRIFSIVSNLYETSKHTGLAGVIYGAQNGMLANY